MKTCCNGHKVMIELQKSELVYDIKNTAYTFADSISSGVSDLHSIHQIYDVGEEGNRDKLARILDSARSCFTDLRRWKCWVADSIQTNGKSALARLQMKKSRTTWL